jgi:beta-N-acetylhexosaminidase
MTDYSLRQKIGQKLMTGLPGTSLDEDTRRLVEKYKIANFILFSRNVNDKYQLSSLCKEIWDLVQRETGAPPFIAMDQEGGTVTRLPADATNIPCAMAFAATQNPKNAYDAGLITGRELRALGINFNFAPVLDVNSNPQNYMVGVRSYGDTPETVIRYGLQMAKGLSDAGVLCLAKHFPGHGDTAVDSHIGLPCVNKSLEELEKMELAPFRAAIESGIHAIMTSHILFPQLEREKVPATMSRTILSDLLKGKLGFHGLVFSDCLEMDAIRAYYGTVPGALAAAAAGVDILLISHTASLAVQVSEALEDALRSGKINMIETENSAMKILRCKSQFPGDFQPNPEQVGTAESLRKVQIWVEKSITPIHLPCGTFPDLGRSPCFLGCVPYRVTLVSNEADKSLNFAASMVEKLGGTAIVTPMDPTPNEILAIVEQAKQHSSVVLGTYNGWQNSGQLKLANALAGLSIPTTVIALHDPRDLKAMDEKLTLLAAYEYTSRCFDALARVLTGKLATTGKLSIQL